MATMMSSAVIQCTIECKIGGHVLHDVIDMEYIYILMKHRGKYISELDCRCMLHMIVGIIGHSVRNPATVPLG